MNLRLILGFAMPWRATLALCSLLMLAETGAALASHPGVRHISFTGSVAVGALIQAAAADNAVPGNVAGKDGRIKAYDIHAQARATFANVAAVLAASGARWEDLVDVTVFLTDMAADFSAFNAIWAEYFPDAARAPCRTTVGVSALPTPIAIELKCTAVVEE